MIQVRVKTNTIKTVNAEVTDTPKKIFDSMNLDISGKSINIDGNPLTTTELNSTFEELGVQDGSTARLNCVVKADGANV